MGFGKEAVLSVPRRCGEGDDRALPGRRREQPRTPARQHSRSVRVPRLPRRTPARVRLRRLYDRRLWVFEVLLMDSHDDRSNHARRLIGLKEWPKEAAAPSTS